MQKNLVFHKPNALSYKELETSVHSMLEVLGHHMLWWGLNFVTEICFLISLITIVFKSLWADTTELLEVIYKQTMGWEIIRKVSTQPTPKLWCNGHKALSHPSSNETSHMWKQYIFVYFQRQVRLRAVPGKWLHCFWTGAGDYLILAFPTRLELSSVSATEFISAASFLLKWL